MLVSELLAHDTGVRVLHEAGLKQVGRIALLNELSDQTLGFVKNIRFLSQLKTRLTTEALTNAGVIFDSKMWERLSAEEQSSFAKQLGLVAVSENVPLSMARLSRPLYLAEFKDLQNAVDGRQMGTVDIDPTAVIAQGVFIGEHVKIAANVVIHAGAVIQSRVEIGEGSEIFPQVTLYPLTQIGKRVRVHAGTVIGGDGFGYVFHQGVHHKIWHVGGVQIHDDVEIGAGCSIDMGAFTPTVIGAGCRIDNQVQIGHNSKIGKGCVLCGQSGVAGSAVLEDFVVMGGRAAIGPEAHIGKGTQVAGGAMVNEGAVWPAGSQLGGHPARDLREWIKTFAWLRKNALKKE